MVPDDLDVFVFDAVNLDVFADAGSLLPLSEDDIEDYDDLIPSFLNGCRIDGTIYAVPQLLCTDFLFTRNSDTGMGENASEMDFRPFSMTDAENIPVFYVDVASISSSISADKKELALELLNLITSRELLSKVSDQNGDLKYLLCSRSSVYDDVMQNHPIYQKLKDFATVPAACVFRIKPGGGGYLQEAKKKRRPAAGAV